MKNEVLISLAILKANFDQGKDIYGILSPLVLDAIKRIRSGVISVPSIKQEVMNSFGINIPFHVIDTILVRLRNENYVEIDKRSNSVRTTKKLDNHDEFMRASDDLVNEHERLIEAIVNYGKEVLNISVSNDEAEKALLVFLDNFQIEIFCKDVSEKVIPIDIEKKDKDIYIIASFLQYLESENSPTIKIFENIAKGYMISNSLYLPVVYPSKQRFNNTKIFFDTTFLIYALGYAGEQREAPCVELLNLLYELGANLYCFQHTLDEMKNVLENVSVLIEQNRIDDASFAALPTIEYFLSVRASRSDIIFYKTRLEENLKSIRITIAATPDYSDHSLQIDESTLKEALAKSIPYSQNSENAINRDVKSISSVFRLRGNKACTNVEDSKALFITSNFKLARSVRDFFSSVESETGFPICITDNVLTNLIWLKMPLKSPDLPLKRIIADSFAMVKPSQELMNRYKMEIEKLRDQGKISEENFYQLRYELSAQNLLMEKTLGQEGAFTQGTISEILELIDSKTQKRLMKELEDTRREKENLNNDEVVRLEKMRNRANKISNRIVTAIKIIIIAILIYCGVWDFLRNNRNIIGFTAIALLIYFIFDLIDNIFFGLKLRRLENCMFKKIYAFMLNIAGYEDVNIYK